MYAPPVTETTPNVISLSLECSLDDLHADRDLILSIAGLRTEDIQGLGERVPLRAPLRVQ